MIRPRLVLATFALLTLGVAAGPTPPSSPASCRSDRSTCHAGPGFYLNLFKFVPVVLIYLLWAWTTDWVERRHQGTQQPEFEIWNSVIFFSGVLGLVLALAIPVYSSAWPCCSWPTSSRSSPTSMSATRRFPTTRRC